jgi:hypothetical protein
MTTTNVPPEGMTALVVVPPGEITLPGSAA